MNVFVIVSHCEENKTTNEVMAHPHFFCHFELNWNMEVL